ncbi:MAG TPA: DUF2254 family protein [Euzebya sp.]|nr:DUF2254 family protein [Euzebya sp.]
MRFERSGWVRQIDLTSLMGCVPQGGMITLETNPGRYAIAGTVMCTIAPPPEDAEHTDQQVRATAGIESTRTMQQDVSYGLRQLVDVALKALSPGINDPTTAQDAIFHAAAVLLELLRRSPNEVEHIGEGDRRLVLCEQPTHGELVRLAFDETRRAASDHPTVCIYLLEALELLHESLGAAGLHDRLDALADEARLVVAGCGAADLVPQDVQLVRAAYAKRFGSTVS